MTNPQRPQGQQGFPGTGSQSGHGYQQGYGYQQGAYPYQGQPFGQGAQQAQPSQFAPYGQYGGFPPAPRPPRKRKTGLWVALTAGLVVVAAFAVTAFAAPGFLLEDEDDLGNFGENRSKAQAVTEMIATSLAAREIGGLRDVMCQDASPRVEEIVRASRDVRMTAEPKSVRLGRSKAFGGINVDTGGRAGYFEAVLAKERGRWCWVDVTHETGVFRGSPTSSNAPSSESATPSGSGSGNYAGATAVFDDFLVAINEGDKASAMSYVCSDWQRMTSPEVADAIAAGATLKWSKDDLSRSGERTTTDVYSSGNPVGNIGAHHDGGTFCVAMFLVSGLR